MYETISGFLNSMSMQVNNLDLRSLSIDQALFNFTDEILSTLNNKTHVHGISCDLSEAFDFSNEFFCQNYIFMES